MKKYYNMTTDEALLELGATTDGLSSKEAAERLAKYGKNKLDEGKKRSLIARFFDQLKDIMIIVLIAAAAVSAVIAIVQGEYSELIDSGIILLIVLVNAFIGLAQESKAEAALDALKKMNHPEAKVIRDGVLMKIDSADIVVGDLVVLEAGDSVPADIRLISSASLKIEEAALTGESVPSEKDINAINKDEVPLGDRKNMAFSSGAVAYGRGSGVVVATGMNTEVGKIAEMLSSSEKQTTPLQAQLAKTAKILSIMVLAIAVVIFAVTLIKAGFSVDSLVDSFMTAVAIAVAAIPEGLPAVVTIVLAIGVQRMSEKKAIVRNLPAVETLGCCQIICSDKTGTLTLNQMTVKELYTPESGHYDAEKAADKADEKLLLKGMVLCNDTVLGEGKLLGDPTETALVAYAQKLGEDIAALNNANKRVAEIPFDSQRKLMSTVNSDGEKETAYIKGAPDILINKCRFIQVGATVREITAQDVEEIQKANNEMARKALRVLAVATKTEDLNLETLEEGLTFIGLVGMIDPPRPEVKEAVRVCKRAGMRAVMITGDHIDTARAIAEEIGILEKTGDELVISGMELDKLSDEEFLANIDRYRVFARVSPENKVRIVKAFKAKGYIVAMTGDGVNDAPSIKIADIGIGMGITGTDVSKGASDMVLADDNFATIISAVEEGRKVYANIKKAIQFLLSANIAEVLCLFLVTLIMPSDVKFLTPVMILWVNLVTDSLPALALGMEKADSDVMLQAPRKPGQSLFAGKTGLDIIIQGVMQTALVMLSYFLGYYVFEPFYNLDDHLPMTMAFVTLCMIQLFHAYNMRSAHDSLFSGNPLDNKFLNLAFIVGTVLLTAVVAFSEFPGFAAAFDTMPLHRAPIGLIVSVVCAMLIIPFVELQKLIYRKTVKRNA